MSKQSGIERHTAEVCPECKHSHAANMPCTRPLNPLKHKEEHGYWSEHPNHPIEDWKYEIANDDTKQGYWEWAQAREEENATV